MGISRDSERDFIVSSHVELISSVLRRHGVVLIIESVRLSNTLFFCNCSVLTLPSDDV